MWISELPRVTLTQRGGLFYVHTCMTCVKKVPHRAPLPRTNGCKGRLKDTERNSWSTLENKSIKQRVYAPWANLQNLKQKLVVIAGFLRFRKIKLLTHVLTNTLTCRGDGLLIPLFQNEPKKTACGGNYSNMKGHIRHPNRRSSKEELLLSSSQDTVVTAHKKQLCTCQLENVDGLNLEEFNPKSTESSVTWDSHWFIIVWMACLDPP